MHVHRPKEAGDPSVYIECSDCGFLTASVEPWAIEESAAASERFKKASGE